MLRLRRMPLAQLRLRALLKPSQSKPYGFASSPKGESFIKVKIMSETKLSHFDASGSAVMVDVSEKPVTARQAVARGIITMNAAAFAAVRDGTAQKGDVLGVARIAGIMAAKRTSELIPLCHPLPLSKLTVDFHLLPEQQAVEAVCTARTIGVTGVEMEALTGVSAALLTIYDMCKAVGGGELVGLAPRGFVRINRPGGVSHYAHGGISLQELCVPVVRVRYGGSRSKRITDAALAEVKPLDTNRRITSMVFRVRLYQPQPVGGKVAPATYDLVLVDGAGNPVSDVRRAVADRDCADEQGRVMEVLFNLRAGRAFAASEPLYLVARDRQTGNVAWREEYRADIAFAPMDDFGF